MFIARGKAIALSGLRRAQLVNYTSKSLVESYVKDHVGVIVLNDPKKLNALTEDMGVQFVECVNIMKKNAEEQKIRSCIITGAGDAFSAGGDLDWLRQRHAASPYANKLTMIKFYNLFLCVRNIPAPTIAAINGAAIGAGMCMTLACDFRIAAIESKIGFTFSKLGIHPGMGASLLLPRLIPSQVAYDYLLSAKIVTGEMAKSDGLVLKCVTKSEIMDTAFAFAESLNKNSPIAVQSCLNTLRMTKFQDLENGLVNEANAQAEAYASKDFIVGIDAVSTKKSPHFLGWEL